MLLLAQLSSLRSLFKYYCFSRAFPFSPIYNCNLPASNIYLPSLIFLSSICNHPIYSIFKVILTIPCLSPCYKATFVRAGFLSLLFIDKC